MSKDNRLSGMDVRYGGRTIRFEIIVNTDAPEDVLRQRLLQLRRVARGARMDMTIATAGEVPADQARGLWDALIAAAHKKVEDES